MIKILILEDNSQKFKEIKEVLLSVPGVTIDNITHCYGTHDARNELLKNEFDLFLTDLVVPVAFGEDTSAEESMSLIFDIKNDPEYNKPLNILGLSAFGDEIDNYKIEFEEDNWFLIQYKDDDDSWIVPIKNKIEYILGTKNNTCSAINYNYDIAIICALNEPEFTNIKKLSDCWTEVKVNRSSLTFYETYFERDKKKLKVIACTINQMGMVPTSILATQIIEMFRPKYITMTGIAAGIEPEVELGDILVFQYSWDYNSGKIKSDKNGNEVFEQDIRQHKLDDDLYNYMLDLQRDEKFLFDIYTKYGKTNRAKNFPSIKIGHATSGAAVIANKNIAQKINTQERKLMGIEMEAYAIYSAAALSTNPKPLPLVLKSICDFADENKNDNIQDYAAYTSAQVLYEYSLRYL